MVVPCADKTYNTGTICEGELYKYLFISNLDCPEHCAKCDAGGCLTCDGGFKLDDRKCVKSGSKLSGILKYFFSVLF